MCGIVGVVRRRATRPVPDAAALVKDLDRALAGFGTIGNALDDGGAADGADLTGRLLATASAVEVVDAALRGVPGVRALLGDPQAALLLADRVEQLTLRFDALERDLDDGLGAELAVAELERVNAALGARTRRGVGRRSRPSAHRPGGRRARRGRSVGCGARGVPLGAGGVVGHRPARGARPRLGRAPPARTSPRPRPRRAGHRSADRRARGRPVVRFGVGARHRPRARLRLQGRGRDR